MKAESRRSLFNVKLASWFVRLSAIFCMITFAVTMAVTDFDIIVPISFIVGRWENLLNDRSIFVFVHCTVVFLLSHTADYVLYYQFVLPFPITTGKIILYIWLFFVNSVLIGFTGYLFISAIPNPEYFFTTWIGILCFFVFLISMVLTVVNIYTFCVLHKNGCCFMNSLNRDVLNVDPEVKV
ncbi:hypothetical protein MAR_006159 [Mya arenaria]|uniref:Uncharacterized protein n=1 Tax=Mya arenaria TaxID=6604 RepID=A0ABY7DC79_MYAAR|nr:hypothetical protein MAR_006159 [Mya arenaria]